MTAPRPGPAVLLQDAFCVHPTPHGGVVALRGLDLEVARGEIVVVHGPNGAGKTTLLRVLAGHQRLTAGRLTLGAGAGAGVGAGAGSAAGAHAIGWIDQRPQRVLRAEFTVVENVALQARLAGAAPDVAHRGALAALAALGLAGLAQRRPASLSGGQAQRVGVCAAMAHGPVLILADEPCGELDRANADLVYATVREAARHSGAAVVLVSHDPLAGLIADRVVRIGDGRFSAEQRAGQGQTSVVDAQGWLRLPDEAQRGLGAERRVRVEAAGGRIVLSAVGSEAGAATSGERAVSADVPGPAVTPGPAVATGPALLTAVDLCRTYPGHTPISATLSVAGGELVGLTGRSGTGKSTVLRLLTGMLEPEGGELHWAGRPIGGWDRRRRAEGRRELMAVIGQPVVLIETADLLQNLAWPARLRGRRIEQAQLDDTVHALGLTRVLGRPVETLSGGERQRVALGAALLSGAPLLVLDEPTSQLDAAGAMAVAALLRERVRAGAAALVATHDPELIAVATRAVALEVPDDGPSKSAHRGCGVGNS